jgi:Skp family chaperone for outer membrane proteins
MNAVVRIVALIGLVLCLSNPAAAKPLDSYRMATVDVNRIMNELEEAQALKKTLDKKSKEAKEKIDKERASLKELESSIKSKGLGGDSAEVDEFRAKARNFERMVKDTEEDLRREFLKDNQQLTKKVLDAVQTYAQKNDIQLVLDKSKMGRGPVLFGDPTADITSDLLEQLND